MHSHDRTLLTSLGFRDPDKSDPRHDLACRYLKQQDNVLLLPGVIWPKALDLGTRFLSEVNAAIHDVESRHADNVSALRAWENTPWQERKGEKPSATPELVLDVKNAATKLKGIADKLSKHLHWNALTTHLAHIECHITKGEGKYVTTIGFADIVCSYSVSRHDIGENSSSRLDPVWGSLVVEKWRGSIRILVEVKIKPVPIGDVIRQLNLYRRYLFLDQTGADIQGTVLACAFPYSVGEVAELSAAGITYVRLGEKFNRWCQAEAARPALANAPEL